MSALPSKRKLQAAWRELREIHQEYLARYDVKCPSTSKYSDTQKAMWLSMLYLNRDREVDKNEMSALAKRDMPHLAADQQVRHLKRDGWHLKGSHGKHKLDPYNPSPEFRNKSARNKARLEASSFDEIKKAFSFRCATCGAKEGRPDPRYGDDHVQLQQGHQDPAKSGGDLKNIIPQCQFCNRAYRNDYEFDEKGRVRAVASPAPVKRASKAVQKKVFEELLQIFEL